MQNNFCDNRKNPYFCAKYTYYVDEMKKVGNVYLCTDDGSEGFPGMVTGLMKDLIENQGKNIPPARVCLPEVMP